MYTGGSERTAEGVYIKQLTCCLGAKFVINVVEVNVYRDSFKRAWGPF